MIRKMVVVILHQHEITRRRVLLEVNCQRLISMLVGSISWWMLNYFLAQIIEILKEYGTIRIPIENKALYSWVLKNKKKYKNGTLSIHKITALRHIGLIDKVKYGLNWFDNCSVGQWLKMQIQGTSVIYFRLSTMNDRGITKIIGLLQYRNTATSGYGPVDMSLAVYRTVIVTCTNQ